MRSDVIDDQARFMLIALVVPSGVIVRLERSQHFGDVSNRKNQLAIGAVIGLHHELNGYLCHACAVAYRTFEIAKCSGVELVNLAFRDGASAVFALGYMFRSDVRALFPRLKKAGPTGLDFDPARQLLAAASKELKTLPGFPDRTPMIAKVETDLQAELDIIDPDKRIDVLIRRLAVARPARNFEQMHRTLLGSQIRALRALSEAEVARRRERSRSHISTKSKRSMLIFTRRTHSTNGSAIRQAPVQLKRKMNGITELGREFLHFMDALSLSDSSRPW